MAQHSKASRSLKPFPLEDLGNEHKEAGQAFSLAVGTSSPLLLRTFLR